MKNGVRYTEEENAFLIATFHTHTSRQQAAALERNHPAIKWQRRKLLQRGLVVSANRAAHRPWTENELWQLEEMARDGYSAPAIAKRLRRTTSATMRAIARRKKTLSELRSGVFAVRTKTDVATLFGVSEGTVKRWIRNNWLYARRNGAKTRRKDKSGAHYLISDDAILTFIERRIAWPAWSPDHITDADWRAAAQDARRRAHGQWLSVQACAKIMYCAEKTVLKWLEDGRWTAEQTRNGRHWFVWKPDGEPLMPPQDRRCKLDAQP